MKRIIIIFSLIICIQQSNAQCIGGSLASNITPSTSWQFVNGAAGGTYYTFNGTAGNTYSFSFCSADGGNSIYDTQISLLNSFGNYLQAGVDDYCGLNARLDFYCTVTATYRVLLTKYNCVSQNNMGKVAYKYIATPMCPTGFGTGVTNVASLPYTSGAGSTAGGVNDLTSSNMNICSNASYLYGEDKVWIFTPITGGNVTITLLTSSTKGGMYLFKGCPLNGNTSTCVASSLGGANPSMTICVEQAATYYLVIDSRSNTFNFTYSNLTITAPSAVSTCSIGTEIAIPSLPYNSIGRTTCGKGNEITSANTMTCGNNSYLFSEDEVFTFTPISSGNITVGITSSSSYSGIFLFEGCPLTSYCAATGNKCIGSSTSASGTKSLCGYVIAGRMYYVVVDNYNSCFPYSINISSPASNLTGATCANPVIVSSLPFIATKESTTCMGDDYNNFTTGSCGSLYESGEDKVYRYDSPGSECVGITLSASSTNSIGFQVYNGIPGNAGVTCIGSGGGAYAGTLTGSVTLSAAGTYYFMVDTWADPTNANYNITLSSYGNAVANDLPCNAIMIPIGNSVTGDNSCSGGSGEPPVPACWITPNSANTVWYSFVAPSSGKAIIRTSTGSLRNTQIALYAGTCGTSLTYVSCNDNASACGGTSTTMSQISATTLVAGNIYYVSVDGYNSFTGSFGISVLDGANPLPAVPGQDCSLALSICKSVTTVGDPGFQTFGNICDFNGGGTNCISTGERGTVWYEIQIASNGNMEFTITPNDWEGSPSLVSTDYDFVMWKTTGTGATSCGGISAGATPIRCNYSFLGVTGLYGASNGLDNPAYPGFGAANQAQLPVLAGEVYVIAISNYSNSVSGFRLEFSNSSPINYTPTPSTVVWTGGVDNDWFNTENWGGCALPSCATNAIILSASANQPIINASGSAAKSLTVNAGASLTINPSITLTLCQNLSNSGLLNALDNATILLNGNLNQTIAGSLTGKNALPNFTITKTGGTATLSNDIDVNANLIISDASSTFDGNGKKINLKGNFANNGGSFIAGNNGNLTFSGNSTQTYFNVGTINSVTMLHAGSGILLLSNMNVGTNGIMNFSSGKIITTNNFEVNETNSSSSAINAGNATSYVEGTLRRSLPSVQSPRIFEFPVGNANKGFQRATLNFYAGATPTISSLAMTFNNYSGTLPNSLGQDPSCTPKFNSISLDNGYWNLTPQGNGQADMNMTLYNTNYTNPSNVFSIMESLNSGSWFVPNVVSGSCISSAITSVTRNGIGITHANDVPISFGIAQGNSALPITLLSFIAEPGSNSIMTTWMTATEKNNKGFEIQRATKPDQFVVVGWTNAAGNGNSTLLNTYNFEDKNVNANVLYYYRLRQVDLDGKESYSKTVAAIIHEKGVVILNAYPNPYSVATTIKYIISRPTIVTIEISDMSGKLVKKYQQGLQNEGSYAVPFSGKEFGLNAGLYNVVIWCDDERHQLRLTETE